MPQQIINLGATGSGAGGDSARTAFEKAIANFAELYIAALPGTAAQKQAARNVFGLGTAATATVQSNATDTTAGALMTVGAFGLGASSAPSEATDCNNLTRPGFYAVGGSAANRPAYTTAAASGLLVLAGGTSTRCSQLHFMDSGSSNSSLRVSVRRLANSGWGTWQELYHDGNTLGTVSQSGGVPTGAIIERGSNANGEYVRFADGTQICRHLGNFPANGVSGWRMVWQFPAPFAIDSAVFISGTVNTVDTGLFSSQRAYFSAVSARSRAGMDTSSSMLDVLIMPGATFATADVTPPVALVAIGRWF